MRVVIRNACLPAPFTPPGFGPDERVSVWLNQGCIEGFNLDGTPDLELDAKGGLLVPAFIDLHAHLRDPGQEVKEDLITGLAAAAAGGYGTVVSMPNTTPPIDDASQVSDLVERAERLGGARLRPAAAVTRNQDGRQLTDMAALRAAGVSLLTDDGRTLEDAGVLRRALEYARPLGLVIATHAEDAALRSDGVMNEGPVSERLGLPGNPALAETARIARDLEIVEQTGGRLHLQHLSVARSLELVTAARARGVRVTCEVTPHHLTLSDAALESEDWFADPILKVAPPLRAAADVQALVRGLEAGEIEAIATDHAPHTRAEKESDMLAAPSGIASLEVSFALLYTRLVEPGLVRLERVLSALTSGPAAVLGLAAPSLEVGADADLTILDLATTLVVEPQNFKSKAKFSPWAGERLRGWPVVTLVRGRVVYKRDA